MTECWAEGSLRAYHDGELPPAEMERVAAHLSECPVCEALADEVAGRAVRVQNLLAALPGPEQVIWMPRRAPQPVRTWPRWAAAAVALAAGIAIALAVAPKHRDAVRTQPPIVAQVSASTGAPVQTAGVAVDDATPVTTIGSARRQTAKRPRPTQVFLALDDEPIETGVVIRVKLGDAEIPADVVFGRDGRAHAIRLVNGRTSY